jgi:hypothetical protein
MRENCSPKTPSQKKCGDVLNMGKSTWSLISNTHIFKNGREIRKFMTNRS